jgi:HD-GYP domain-containing protein (c-di-GMP phosphodiesterase class II)
MLEVLGNAIAKRDSDTSDHNYRVTTHSIYLGKALGLSKPDLCSLIKGAFLHDIGKIAISDTILLKPGKLTVPEFDVIKTHVTHGSDIIRSYPWLADAADVVFHHHEKYNGNGYPSGLKGEQIPLNARIFAIIDVFDALTSKRPYKEPIPFDTTLQIMAGDVGSHFDPEIFEVFRKGARELHEVISGFTEPELVKILHSLMHDYFETVNNNGQ